MRIQFLQIEPFVPEKHFRPLEAWTRARGLMPPDVSWLPETGVVACLGDVPVAMQWLYRERLVGMGMLAFATTTTDAAIGPFVRWKALLATTDWLEMVAKDSGYSVLLTMGRGSMERFYRLRGFVGNHTGMRQLFKRI